MPWSPSTARPSHCRPRTRPHLTNPQGYTHATILATEQTLTDLVADRLNEDAAQITQEATELAIAAFETSRTTRRAAPGAPHGTAPPPAGPVRPAAVPPVLGAFRSGPVAGGVSSLFRPRLRCSCSGLRIRAVPTSPARVGRPVPSRAHHTAAPRPWSGRAQARPRPLCPRRDHGWGVVVGGRVGAAGFLKNINTPLRPGSSTMSPATKGHR